MIEPAAATNAAGATALYRRFRPGRFAELRGQDHVVRALQGAVKNGRVVHAYLFSGPRGTGKTTAARVLAKALNCERPVDGDACDECASCVAITRGSSLDVTELDAASNNGVDDIREITAGAWHQTPGRWKVYIFDEVHQLSKAASAALLKTLEEPPSHVVFVLATTDPHKVLPTIRSRTQHLEFRLFSGETLSSLLHDIRQAADLPADEETLDAAVRLGRGSARDALSALDQLVATGSTHDVGPVFDGLLGALADADAVAALRELAKLTGDGWDPEQLTESFAAEVRQVFLLQVAPDVADAVDQDRERLSSWGERLGLARSVRILETFGRALREMKSAPEKVAVLEVALVRLVHPELDNTVEALGERLSRLERGASTPPPSAPAPAPVLRPIGSVARTPAPEPTATTPSTTSSQVSAPVEASVGVEVVEATVGSRDELTLEEVRERFVAHVVSRTSRAAQMLLRPARVTAYEAGRVTIALPSEEVRRSVQDYAAALQRALDHEFKSTLHVEWTVDPTLATSNGAEMSYRSVASSRVAAASRRDEPDDEDAGEASAVVVESAADHLINEFFPGSEEVR
ncbi:MAG TPA: DNA polymerase III subunit gamma/tau [Acidimicrobiales bacterium]|nr:DNA polymerase III subunit gamma/tau [Acidimicrobiales bacterium]